jgi:hyperosmotically inducible periplasmic protein
MSDSALAGGLQEGKETMMRSMQKEMGILVTFICLLLVQVQARADVQAKDDQLLALGSEKLAHAKVGDQVALKVQNSVATLEGSVDSVGLRERAGKEVSKVNGIVGVTNNLQVITAGRTDDKIAEAAVHAIRMYPYYTIFDNVELEAQSGRIRLTGAVVQPWRREDIGRAVSLVSGVTDVTNDIEVLPLSPFDDEIRMRVARAIYRNGNLIRYGNQANPSIHVVVKNGNVTLAGVVNNEVDKAIAGQAARFADVYLGLDNNLVVETAAARKKP